MSNPSTVDAASETLPIATTSTLSSVAAATTDTPLLAANYDRKGMNLFNESTAILYLALSATATTSAYTTQVPPNSLYEMPLPIYPGAIHGIWAAANGFARITEFT